MARQWFADRRDAGRQLAVLLVRYRDRDPVVLALPRGGVPVGFEVARALGAPLDLLLARKIGHPYQPELAVGAIAEGSPPVTVVTPGFERPDALPEGYLAAEGARQLEEIGRRRRTYLRGRKRPSLAGRTAIVVDDGIATGSTVRAALRAARQEQPRALVLAVPVAPATALAALAPEADEVVCLESPETFWAIGAFYDDFHQLDDAEVTALLDAAAKPADVAR